MTEGKNMLRFNVTGLCVPSKNYMVDISGKLNKIIALIDDGSYFTINRARQYGKTTTLSMIQKTLSKDYICSRISFEGLGDESFATPAVFCRVFMELVQDSLKFTDVSESYQQEWFDESVASFVQLSRHITKMCRDKKLVLMIDEVDKSSNNNIYLHFLGILREKFLSRQDGMDFTFHSVILAGVYDIKNIKLRMIRDGSYAPAAAETKIYNSPWNIAVDFDVDMSFNPSEIATMLLQYEDDYDYGMDITSISNEIYYYTGGYPYLVSRICKHIDEKLNREWTLAGVRNAVEIVIKEENVLFDDLFKNLENDDKLYDLIYDVLITGKQRMYSIGNPTVKTAAMYGLIVEAETGIAISNKIFELVICNYFISKDEELNRKRITGVLQYDVVNNGFETAY